jgi:MFS family permease
MKETKLFNSRTEEAAVPIATPEGTRDIASDRTYRWIVLACIFCASTIGVIDRITWGNVSIFYARDFGTSVAALGSFFSAFYVGYFITNALSGFGADWFGGRRMLIVSLLLLGASTFLFGCTTSIALGLVVQCVMGLVAGMDYSACVRLLSDVFPPERKTTAMGIFLSSMMIGVTLPNLFVPTLAQEYGWQGVYQILGVATAMVGIAVYFILGKRSELYAKRAGSPAPAPKALFSNRGFRIAAIAGFGQQWGVWGFAFWSNALLVKGHHIDPVKAGLVIALYSATAGLTKVTAGWVVDQIRLQKPLIGAAMCLLFAIALALFGALGSIGGFTALAVVIGFAAGVAGVIVATLSIETAGPQFSGSASGTANALWILGNMTVPLVVGGIFQYVHSFQAALLALAAGPAFSTLCFMYLWKLGIVRRR